MDGMNLCNGCFYEGATGGCKPECDCEIRSRYEGDGEEQEDENVFWKTKKTSYQRHWERRRNARKADKKAKEALFLTEAKYGKMPDDATPEDWWRAEKKCRNTAKKAKRNKQTTIILSLPATVEKMKDGVSAGSIAKLEAWMYGTSSAASECKKAIKTLEIARNCEGEIVTAFREGRELHVTIGFYSKKALSNFKRKYEKAS